MSRWKEDAEFRERVGHQAKTWVKEHPKQSKKHMRRSHLKLTYNLTIEEYEYMFREQNGLCDICGVALECWEKTTHIDHDHKSNNVRGLLCASCNQGLGCFKDNIETLQSAQYYLICNGHN